jgi:hypothetical protein
MATLRRQLAGTGTQTAALGMGGAGMPVPTPTGFTNATEEYDGATWTSVNPI